MTAVIVAHDGAAWLPQLADALLGQTRPVQRVVAVDTGSRDRSGAVLASRFGQPAVFGMDRSTGYGAAIARALHHRAANTAVPRPAGGGGQSGGGGAGGGYASGAGRGYAGGGYQSGGPGIGHAAGGSGGSGYFGGSGARQHGQSDERIEWLWLLHDDCEPAPDALEQLLRGVTETSAAAVLGPKLRDWSNRDVIAEAGLTLDTAARRLTGIEPREVDQGQHDGDRDALAVSSAGMLVRRDVWDHVGGFDRAMGLFMDDIDFCWRVHSAGYRVRVITDAIVYHAQAATRHRRPVSVGRRAGMLDRRNGLLTLLGNLPFRHMLKAAGSNVLVSLMRIAFFLLAKRLAAAMDEFSAVTAVLCHPIRLIKMRSARSEGRRAAYSRVRADLPAGRSGRRLIEFVLAGFSRSQLDTVGSHHASADPAEDDSMLIDNGLGRRLLTSPSLLTFVALLALAIAAGRSLIGPGPLGGGSLVPAWGGASDLWGTYLQTFHPVGAGSTTPAPAWLAVIAMLSTLLAGKPWLAIDVIMIGCVPLAGMTAMLAARKVTTSVPVRVWASVTYALLPVATGVIAGGRFGSAVGFVLLPLIVSQAGRMLTRSGPPAGRAAWATGLLVAVAAAFVPLLWLITLAVCLIGAIVLRTTERIPLRNLAIAILTPPLLLLPWTLTFLSHPAQLLLEAGLPQQAAPAGGLPARSLLLLSPGGPGLPPYWVTAGLGAVAFAALFAGRRRRVITAGWGLALTGLLAATVVSHVVVRSGDGGPVTAWPGPALAVAAAGLLLAAVGGADALGRLLAGVKGWRALLSGRGPWAAIVGLAACSSPLLAATAWVTSGISGPIHPVSSPVVPELVAVAAGQARQVRTLVLTSAGGHVSYLLLRGAGPSLADMALSPPPDAQRALAKAVSTLVSPEGGLAADQARLLANFDIGYILVQAPVDQKLAHTLNNVSGIRPYSTTSGYALWQLDTPPARVSVAEPDGTVVPVASGPVGIAAARVPTAGGTLMLAEPAGGWTASVDGHALAEVPSPAGKWAEAFRLPRGGGTVSVGRPGLARDLELGLELLAFLVIAGLALPGMRLAEQEAQAVPPTGEERQRGRGSSRAAPLRTGDQAATGPLADADQSPDEAASPAADGSARRRAALAAVGQAGSRRLTRSARARTAQARADRAETATTGRTGRIRAGRNKPGRAKEGRARHGQAGLARELGARAAADDSAFTDQTAVSPARVRSAGRPAGVPGMREAGPHDGGKPGSGDRRGRLADAWPYASRDEPAGGARDLAADSRPHAGGRPFRDQPAGPPGRAWSYSDAPDPGEPDDFGSTGPSGRSYQHGEREFGGDQRATTARRPPAGRSPVGDWPHPDIEAGMERPRRPGSGRSPSGRSASGAWPDRGRNSGDAGSDRRPPDSTRSYKLSEPGTAGRPGPYEEPGPAGRPGREPAADRDDSYRRPPAGRRGRHGTGRGTSWPGSGRRAQERRDRGPSGTDWAGGEPRERDGAELRRAEIQHLDPGRPAHPAGDSARSTPPGGRRRRGSEGLETDPAGSRSGRWQPGEQLPAWSDDDVLEPLPPLESPGGTQHRRTAWRSAEGARDWDRSADAEDTDGRWSSVQPEFEPEYEGDTW